MANKLGKLKDIEEELGWPLDILFKFKTFKNGIWFINKQGNLEHIDNDEVEEGIEIYLEDDKKTW